MSRIVKFLGGSAPGWKEVPEPLQPVWRVPRLPSACAGGVFAMSARPERPPSPDEYMLLYQWGTGEPVYAERTLAAFLEGCP